MLPFVFRFGRFERGTGFQHPKSRTRGVYMTWVLVGDGRFKGGYQSDDDLSIIMVRLVCSFGLWPQLAIVRCSKVSTYNTGCTYFITMYSTYADLEDLAR